MADDIKLQGLEPEVPLNASPLLNSPIQELAQQTRMGAPQTPPAVQQTPPPPVPPAQPNPNPPVGGNGQVTPPPVVNQPPPPPVQQPQIPSDSPQMFFDQIMGPQSSDPNASKTGSGPQTPPGEIKMPSAQAANFSDTIGNIFNTYVPPIMHTLITKVDENNVMMWAERGLIHQTFVGTIKKVNENNLKTLKATEEEMDTWKKALKDFLEYKNIKAANPESAFYMATAFLVGNMIIKAKQASKETKELLWKAIQTSNPGTTLNAEFFGIQTEEEPQTQNQQKKPVQNQTPPPNNEQRKVEVEKTVKHF